MINRISHFILLVTVLLITCLVPVRASDIVQRVFAERDGLVNGSVSDISFDDYGFTWLATQEGLYRVSNTKVRRIDKNGFKTRLSDEYIQFVRPLSKRHLLVSNYTDTYLYDIIQDTFTRFGSAKLFPYYNNVGLRSIIKKNNGDYYFLSKQGELLTFSYVNMTLTTVNTLPYNLDYPWSFLTELDDRHLLIGSSNKLELSDQSGVFQRSLDWQDDMGAIKGMMEDSSGRLWVSSSDGLYEFKKVDLTFEKVTFIPFPISKTTEDSQGNLWLASREGLIKWDPDTDMIEMYKGDVKRTADIDYIYDIEIDHNDVIWVGGSGDALAVVAEAPDFMLERFTKTTPYLISNEMIWSIWADKNKVWLGSDKGLITVDRHSKNSITILPEELALNGSIYKIDELDSDHLLLSTTNGLFAVNKLTLESGRFSQWTLGQYSLENKIIFSSYSDPLLENRWWFATGNGLFFWQQGALNPQAFLIKGGDNVRSKPDLRVTYRSLDGKLWIAGARTFGYIDDEGLFHSSLNIFDAEAKLPTISYIKEISPGVLWLGSSAGLIEYEFDSGVTRSLTNEWKVDCSSIFFIHEINQYRVLGCLNSILRQNIESGEVLVIEHEDGLISKELNDGASFYDPDSGFYVGTPDGAMLLDVAKLENRIQHDGVLLESVSIFYDEHTEINLVPEPNSIIKPGARMINFQFTSLDYLVDTPLTLQYRIRRKGESKDVNYLLLMDQSLVSFSGLHAGDYVLDILSSQNGIWSSEPSSFAFEVKEFWWQKTWFKSFLVIALFLFGSIILIGRQRQLSAFKRVNEALVESEDRLRQSLKGSGSELWEWRHDTQMFNLENQSAALAGGNANLLLTLEDFPVHRDERQSVLACWNSMINGISDRFEVEYRYRREDKSWGWTRVRGRPVDFDPETGNITRVAGIYSDITAQRQLEDDMRLLAQAFENTSEGVLILDTNERIKVSNKAAQTILGLGVEQLNLSPFSALIVAKEGRLDNIVKLLDESGSWTGEREFICSDGTSCPVWLNVSTMLGKTGSIIHYVAVFSDITERKRSEAELRRLANYDVLTGLPNRSLFSTRLAQSIYRANHTGEKLALVFLDLDRFKHVNDSYGHSMGDALLVEAANRLQSCIPEQHSMCRFGGDEFLILLRNANDVDMINHICTELLNQIEMPFELYGREFFISTSIGVSLWPDDATEPEVLIKNADQAMYHAKEEGKGNFQYYSSERNLEALYHLHLEAELRRAIERDEFELHYQPQVDILKNDSLVGMEALLRWRHHSEGLIRTDTFIKVAESCGLIIDIDRWVLRQACIQGAQWSRIYGETFKLSVNISAVHFRQPDFVEGIKAILKETEIPTSVLGFEITEGVLMKELNTAKSHLKELRHLGIKVAIDDFGTGYSSLAYLRHFDVDTLKIDRSFLIDIATNESDQAIASSIIELARNLKLNVIAEGVETKAQLEQVFSRGCYVIQGYYFSKPLIESDMNAYMERNKLDS
ncbi:diguanylate cyclase [Shewanella hanedai]|uniref:EAL domain-containing protein n=1 Tax=Shewanella hanedai TaxID=25 RepID=A0A553JIC2_SHEHA|nr:EAL domain-containing protein [Shewanella hanedai]TRY12192.1 EAL domain-containing protein [Shewanella hanedai]GGJ00910.1 diguanylate cyclase [Shewanella hanedai]